VIAAPSLRADLHASGAQLQLIVGMYTLAFGALVVAGARLGDVLGYRRVFLLVSPRSPLRRWLRDWRRPQAC
jgi:MFS family permease